MESITDLKSDLIKQTIIDIALKYVKNNQFNISSFRNSNPSIYNRIPYYFGSIKLFKSYLQKKHSVVVTQNYSNQSSKNEVSFKTLLLYDYLTLLKSTMTYQEIADKYNVSRQFVHNVFHSVSSMISNSNLIENEDLNEENK